jgi:hypothetical protein
MVKDTQLKKEYLDFYNKSLLLKKPRYIIITLS